MAVPRGRHGGDIAVPRGRHGGGIWQYLGVGIGEIWQYLGVGMGEVYGSTYDCGNYFQLADITVLRAGGDMLGTNFNKDLKTKK